jgi:copper chaperone
MDRYTRGGYYMGERSEACLVSETITYSVPEIYCSHCEGAIKREIGRVAGVEAVDVDLERKLVTVRSERLEEEKLRAAIGEAGFDVAA